LKRFGLTCFNNALKFRGRPRMTIDVISASDHLSGCSLRQTDALTFQWQTSAQRAFYGKKTSTSDVM